MGEGRGPMQLRTYVRLSRTVNFVFSVYVVDSKRRDHTECEKMNMEISGNHQRTSKSKGSYGPLKNLSHEVVPYATIKHINFF